VIESGLLVRKLRLEPVDTSSCAYINSGVKLNGRGPELGVRVQPIIRINGKLVTAKGDKIALYRRNGDGSYHVVNDEFVTPYGKYDAAEDLIFDNINGGNFATCNMVEPIKISDFPKDIRERLINQTPVEFRHLLTAERTSVPGYFRVEDKKAIQIGEITAPWKYYGIKSLTELPRVRGEKFFIGRIFHSPYSDKPEIVLFHRKKGGRLCTNELGNLEPVASFAALAPKDSNAVLGISSAVDFVDGCWLVFFHVVTSLEPDREYHHGFFLLDPDNPTKIIAFSERDVLNPSHFCCDGDAVCQYAVYFRNFIYNPYRKTIESVVSARDMDINHIRANWTSWRSVIRPVRGRELTINLSNNSHARILI